MTLDPTHIAATTSAIATIILSKAIEKSGEHIGDAVYQRIGNLINTVKEKFQQQGELTILTEAQENPSEQTLNQFTQELLELMIEDNEFAATMDKSIATFSENSEIQAILKRERKKYDLLLHQPLSVSQFRENLGVETRPTRQALKVREALRDLDSLDQV
jgi:hypothetical protein